MAHIFKINMQALNNRFYLIAVPVQNPGDITVPPGELLQQRGNDVKYLVFGQTHYPLNYIYRSLLSIEKKPGYYSFTIWIYFYRVALNRYSHLIRAVSYNLSGEFKYFLCC